jgi:NTE family protein
VLYAQNNDDENHPKIGLVLSGGGAKGFAYIGVLRAMEEAGIRPDYITGTSIGSVVGGLYAIGYSPDQLDTIIRSIDWGMVLSNDVPLTYISFEEKEYYNRYLITLPFIDKKLTLPSGIIEGQMLSDLLNELTWPAMKYESFDDFPIPFRCVTTDVSTGNTIIFDKGSLADAMRASMSIPSAFTAVDLDTTLAVDGGILDNFPVREVRKMGADFVIGFNLSTGLENAKDIGSLSGILTQISMFESLKRLNTDIDSCDFYIKLDMEGYSTADFGKAIQILAVGDSNGVRNEQRFKDLAKELNVKSKKVEHISLVQAPIVISEITIVGNVHVPKKLILSKLNLPFGEFVSQKDVEDAILRAYGINSFKKVVYNIKPSNVNEGEFVLQVRVVEKERVNLKASVHYDNIFSAGVLLNFTLRNILGRGSRTLFIGDISENPRFRFDYLKYFGAKERFALEFTYDFLKLEIPQYQEGKKIDVLSATTNKFSFGIRSTQSLKHTFIGGINYSLNLQKYDFTNTFPDFIKNVDFKNIKLYIGVIKNSTNDRNYPTKGRYTLFYINYIFGNTYTAHLNDGFDSVKPIVDSLITSVTPKGYGRVYLSHRAYYHLLNKFQLIAGISFGTTISTADTNTIFEDYNIGGNQMVTIFDTQMLGLHYAELIKPNFAKLSLLFQNVILKNIYLRYGAQLLSYYPYVPIDNLSLYNFNDMVNNYSLIGYGFQIRYKSIIGPISFGMSGNTRDKYIRYYVQIGFSMNYND